MDVEEAIHARRSIAKVTDERPDRSDIAALLDAAVRAPTHHLTQPWRFIVLAGSALDDLGVAMAERLRASSPDADDLAERMELERSRPRRAPVIIVVIYTPSTNPKAVEVEDRYSVGAAMQNILLAATGRGLGAYLRTGPASRYAGVERHLGLEEAEEIAGLIYVGIPAGDQDAALSRRTAAEDMTEFRGWD